MALSKGRTAIHGQDSTVDIGGVLEGKEDEGPWHITLNRP